SSARQPLYATSAPRPAAQPRGRGTGHRSTCRTRARGPSVLFRGLLDGRQAVAAGADLLGDRAEVDLELRELAVAVVVRVTGELGRTLLGLRDDLLGPLVGERDDVLLPDQPLGLLLRLLQPARGLLPGLGEHLLG